MKPGFADLGRRLAALRARLMDTGARAGQAAAALAAGVPPDTALIEELRTVAPAVAELRAAVLGYAADAGVAAADGIATADDLERLVATIAQTEAERARHATWDETRGAVLAILQRVVSLVHLEEVAFAPLAACQAKAREMAASLPAEAPADVQGEAERVTGRAQPFDDLATLADGWNSLDDDRCALLQESIAEAFGRQLGSAALRGKLGRAGAPPPARPRAAAPVPAAAPASSIPRIAPPPPPPSTLAPPPSAAPTIAPPPSVLPPVMPAPPAAPSLADDLRRAASAESPQAREQRRATLERLAKDTAPWWVAARAGWSAMHKAGQSLEAAAPRLVERFPYLLSVPLQAAAQRGVAEGYALLLEHVEQQEPGFVEGALLRLNPELTGHGSDQRYLLGPELYAHIVAEGRLYKTYPDFVRTVIASALPKPGVWLQGWLVEEADRTLIVTRPDGEAGAGGERRRELTTKADRFATHTLSATLAPLTARAFGLEARGKLDPATDVDVLLAANETPSADAWIVTIPVGGGAPAAPRRHKVSGTSLALGTEVGTAWIVVFNPDPNAERRYDLALGLRRKEFSTTLGARPGASPKGPSGKKSRSAG